MTNEEIYSDAVRCIKDVIEQNNGLIKLGGTEYELVNELDWLGVSIQFKFRKMYTIADSIWVSYDVHLPTSLAGANSLLGDLPKSVVIALADAIRKLNQVKQIN